MWFNNRGPVPVSDEDFASYQKLIPPCEARPFEALYCFWIDEHHQDALRRLALRDMLWQCSDKLHDSDGCYFRTEAAQFTEIAKYVSPGEHHVRGLQDLREMLRFRPKLLGELVEEFLWLPSEEDQGIHHVFMRSAQTDAEIAETLLPLVDEPTGRKLWRRHYASEERQHVARLGVWERLADDPRWLSDELRQQIREDLEDEVKDFTPLLIYRHTVESVRERVSRNALPLLMATIGSLRSYQHNTDQRNLRHFVELTRILADVFPNTFCYLDFCTLCKVIPELHSVPLILQICQWHIAEYREDPTLMFGVTALEAKNFLCWLYGVIAVFANDPAFLNNITECLRQVTQRSSEFAADPRPVAQSEQPSAY